MSNQCTYCNKIFSNKYALIRHQKTAKFCLKIQSTTQSSTIDPISIQYSNKKYKCNYCNYTTSHKFHLNRHLKSCKEKKEQEQNKMKELQDEVLVLKTKNEMLEEFKDLYKKEVSKPKTTVNNNVTLQMRMDYCRKNLAPYEDFLQSVEINTRKYFNISDLEKGVEGFIMVLNRMLPPTDDTKYLVTFERSNQTFYRNRENKIEIDDKANKFLNEVFPIMRRIIYDEKYRKEFDEWRYSDPERCSMLLDKYDSITKIGFIGSLERKKCVDAISKSFCISNSFLKSQTFPGNQCLLECTEGEEEETILPKIIEDGETDNTERGNDIDINQIIKCSNNKIKKATKKEDDLITKYKKVKGTGSESEWCKFEARLDPEEKDILSEYLTREEEIKEKGKIK